MAKDVVSILEYLFEVRGGPEFIRSDNGPEFIAEAVRGWLAGRGARTLVIAPGSPRENAYSETFNSRLRDELLDRAVFETMQEASVIVEDHLLGYNHRRLTARCSIGPLRSSHPPRSSRGSVRSPRPTSCRSLNPHSHNPWTRIRGRSMRPRPVREMRDTLTF